MKSFTLLGRLLQFRRELVTLWRAFLSPTTPLHLKALMLTVPLYLLMPLDLIPDFVPFAGLLDDIVVIPLLVSWIVGLVPQAQPAPVEPEASPRPHRPGEPPTIDGTWRRL